MVPVMVEAPSERRRRRSATAWSSAVQAVTGITLDFGFRPQSVKRVREPPRAAPIGFRLEDLAMCGIVGTSATGRCRTAPRGAAEARIPGYDSAGSSMVSEGTSSRCAQWATSRRCGRPWRGPRRRPGPWRQTATTGLGPHPLGHARPVSEQNAHPLYDTATRSTSCSTDRGELPVAPRAPGRRGCVFTSETDAEVSPISSPSTTTATSPRPSQAYTSSRATTPSSPCRRRARPARGARKECPLIVGRGRRRAFFASAIPAFLSETRRVSTRERRDRDSRGATP
jgi:glucosamine--fructose-6-phosphate aminotransferase (isomerizing)